MGGTNQSIGASQLRSFGLLLGGIFGIIALWPLLWRGDEVRVWALVVSGLIGAPALVWPTLLRPVYTIWMRIGAALGWFNTRVILSFGFYLVFTPIGLVMRLLGKDPMRRKGEPHADSYRLPCVPRPGTHMSKPF